MNESATFVCPRLPLSLSIELVKCDEDAREYFVICAIEGSPETALGATVRKPARAEAVLVELTQEGVLSIANQQRTRMILLAFDLLYDEMLRADGNSVEWHMNDASEWLGVQLGRSVASNIIRAAKPYVCSGKPFQSWSAVRID